MPGRQGVSSGVQSRPWNQGHESMGCKRGNRQYRCHAGGGAGLDGDAQREWPSALAATLVLQPLPWGSPNMGEGEHLVDQPHTRRLAVAPHEDRACRQVGAGTLAHDDHTLAICPWRDCRLVCEPDEGGVHVLRDSWGRGSGGEARPLRGSSPRRNRAALGLIQRPKAGRGLVGW